MATSAAVKVSHRSLLRVRISRVACACAVHEQQCTSNLCLLDGAAT